MHPHEKKLIHRPDVATLPARDESGTQSVTVFVTMRRLEIAFRRQRQKRHLRSTSRFTFGIRRYFRPINATKIKCYKKLNSFTIRKIISNI
jgi:hypothetical protein